MLNTDSVTLGETALVHIVDPANLSLDFRLRLEGNDVLSLDDVAPPRDGCRDGCREGIGEQSSNFTVVSSGSGRNCSYMTYQRERYG